MFDAAHSSVVIVVVYVADGIVKLLLITVLLYITCLNCVSSDVTNDGIESSRPLSSS